MSVCVCMSACESVCLSVCCVRVCAVFVSDVRVCVRE